jgi:hypothetical protein
MLFETKPLLDDRPLKAVRAEKLQEALKRKYEKQVFASVASFGEMISDIEAGAQYRFVTTKGFNAMTVVVALSQRYDIRRVTMAVYRMNMWSVDKIKDIAGSGVTVNLLLSSFFRENKKYEEWCRQIEAYSNSTDLLRVGFAMSHAKICLIKTDCGRHIVFEGSGNLSDNARVEQYMLEDCKEAFDFHEGWILDIIDGKTVIT